MVFHERAVMPPSNVASGNVNAKFENNILHINTKTRKRNF